MAEEIGGVDSATLAQATAEAVANNPLPEPEVVDPALLAQDPEIAPELVPEVAPEPEVAAVVPEVPVTPEPEVAPPTLDELTLELARVGLDLGINRAELAPELQPAYDRLAQQALLSAQQSQDEQARLADAQAEIQQFAQKLQDDPEKVLLTMAITNPEAFQASVQAYEKMAEDDFYRDTVIKDLKAEAKLAATERKSHLLDQRTRQAKIAQVTRATRLAADQYSVDHGMAEELVAAAITRGGGDIELNQIAGVVARLAPAARPAIPVQEKVARTAQAPTLTTQGQGTPAVSTEPEGPEISPGLTPANRNPFLDLVRGAAGRLRSGE